MATRPPLLGEGELRHASPGDGSAAQGVGGEGRRRGDSIPAEEEGEARHRGSPESMGLHERRRSSSELELDRGLNNGGHSRFLSTARATGRLGRARAHTGRRGGRRGDLDGDRTAQEVVKFLKFALLFVQIRV